MLGLVLAAGASHRLRPYTNTLPKTLLPIDGEKTILELILCNFAEVELHDVAVVVGYCKESVYERKVALEKKYGVTLHLIDNDKAEKWNNAYSLWCAVTCSGRTASTNGDTVHPASVERTLLETNTHRTAVGDAPNILLALDTVKKLADEEMKVVVDPAKGVRCITKLMNPADANGEYLALPLINPSVADDLALALQDTFERDPQLYYEDGYQELVNRGQRVDVQPIGEISGSRWTPRRLGKGPKDCVPILTRLIPLPIAIDIRAGALDDLGGILADQCLSTSGKIAVVISAGSGKALRDRLALQLPRASVK